MAKQSIQTVLLARQVKVSDNSDGRLPNDLMGFRGQTGTIVCVYTEPGRERTLVKWDVEFPGGRVLACYSDHTRYGFITLVPEVKK